MAHGAGGPVHDSFVWPGWAEQVLKRKVTARNYRVLLDELASAGTFDSFRDGARLALAEATLRLRLVAERLAEGAPQGKLLLNFVNEQTDMLAQSLEGARGFATWAGAALEVASEQDVRAFALETVAGIGGYLESFPAVLGQLKQYAVAAGIQLERLSRLDPSLWESLLAKFNALIPKPPAGMGSLVLLALAALLGLAAFSGTSRR